MVFNPLQHQELGLHLRRPSASPLGANARDAAAANRDYLLERYALSINTLKEQINNGW